MQFQSVIGLAKTITRLVRLLFWHFILAVFSSAIASHSKENKLSYFVVFAFPSWLCALHVVCYEVNTIPMMQMRSC